VDEQDVVIVGGGAAGVGAARALAGRNLRVLLVEASARIGGRARTERVGGCALDLGCGWLHSAERNEWVGIAEAAGFPVDRTPSSWGEQYRALGFSPADQDASGKAYDAFNTRLRTAALASDRASDAIGRENDWKPFVEALSGYINGAELEALSVADYLAYDDAASETNWRLPEGYGTLVAASLPRDVAVALATPVTRITGQDPRLKIDTHRGPIVARAVIVTVSTNVLGAIRFDAALDGPLHAASQLPLGLADKLFLAVDGAEDIAADAHLLGDPRNAGTGSYYLRPFGNPVIEAFFGGPGARALGREGLDGAAAFAIDELVALLGSGWRRRLRLVAASRWAQEDWIRGSYSHALPGCAGSRATLRNPVDSRIYFAGEACSAQDFSTAHGAFASGTTAAQRVLGAFG